MMRRGGGYSQTWDCRNEDWGALDKTPELPSVVHTFAIPEAVDPRKLIKVENQGPVGSCRGHSLSTAVEWCYYVATGQTKQFSRAFAYYGCQKLARTLGRDTGATIYHGRILATEHGLPLEDYWPYVARYSPHPPGGSWDQAYKAADPFKIQRAYAVKTVTDVWQAIGSGQGFVDLGILWGVSIRSDGIMTGWQAAGGGHAVCLCGYLPPSETYRGERLFILANSHGERFGDRGFAYVPESIVDDWCHSSYTAMQVLTDLTTPEPRKIDWGYVV